MKLQRMIKSHYLPFFGAIFGLSGGIFTGLIGFLLGILLEPLVHQFLLERSIAGYLVQADPRFTAEIKPGIAAFCGLAVYCIHPDKEHETILTQKAIVQRVIELFNCSLHDRSQIELFCRIAWDNRNILNGDLLAESLRARLSSDVSPNKVVFALQALVATYSSKQFDRIYQLSHIIDPEAPKAKKNSPWCILGVSPDASVQEIKRTFRRLALQFHPDCLSSLSDKQKQAAEECFITIRQAYRQALSEKTEHKVYGSFVKPR